MRSLSSCSLATSTLASMTLPPFMMVTVLLRLNFLAEPVWFGEIRFVREPTFLREPTGTRPPGSRHANGFGDIRQLQLLGADFEDSIPHLRANLIRSHRERKRQQAAESTARELGVENLETL